MFDRKENLAEHASSQSSINSLNTTRSNIVLRDLFEISGWISCNTILYMYLIKNKITLYHIKEPLVQNPALAPTK